MFIEPTLISVIIAKLRGGRFKNLENVHIRAWYLLILSALIQGILSLFKYSNIYNINYFIVNYKTVIIGITYLLMIITAILNINKNYIKVFLIGIILNLIVIVGNGGHMPVSLEGIKGINQETILPEREFDIKHVAVNKDTKFVYLADIILIPRPYPLPKILSLGDIFLMIGVFVFFQEEMFIEKKKSISQVS